MRAAAEAAPDIGIIVYNTFWTATAVSFAMVELKDSKGRPIVGPTVPMGEALGMTGDRDGAIAEYRAVLKINPENTAAIADLAMLLVENPATQDEALRMVQRQVELSPQFFLSYDRLGLIRAKRGEFEQAEDAFFTSLRMEGGTILPIVRQHLADEMDTRNLWTGDRRELRRLLTAEQTATNVARMMELLAQTAPSNSDTLVTK